MYSSVKTAFEDKGLVKILTSGRGYGGSEKSSLMLMRMFLEDGYRVEFVNWGGPDKVGKAFKAGLPVGVKFPATLTGECDHLVYYTTDTIYSEDFNNPAFSDVMAKVHAKNKVMILNYRLGKAGQLDWTKGWDKYGFLCTQKRDEFQKRLPEATTFVLAPPADLTDYFAVERNYTKKLRLIRHNAQGDAKWPRNINDALGKIFLINKSIEWFCMPAATFMLDDPRIHKFKVNEFPIPEFLKKGNCFIYKLPDGYQDQDPRVIMEAQATGLAVIADNRWGAKDRVAESTGWLCDSHDDYMRTIRDIVELPSLLRTKGQAARKWALKNYDPHKWIEEILK
jgi:glycosyltransferase involved in cell wall biosynthesis